MRNQSNIRKNGELAPISVDPVFPVNEADFNTRGETPNVAAHLHNLCEIGYCFDGSGVFLIGGKILTFKAGDAVFITTQEVHLAKSNPGQTTRWGFLNFDPAGLLAGSMDELRMNLILERCCGDAFRNIIEGEKHPEAASCIRRILLERRDMPHNWQPMLRALLWQLFIELDRLAPETAGGRTGQFRDVRRIIPALDFINAHIAEPLALEQLAKLCATSVPNFRKLFCRAMGCAPYPYITRTRLQLACSMLKNTDESICRTAYAAGFNNISNFNRQFREVYGTAPGEYRKATAENKEE